jgi:hypothetical protein
VASEGLYDRQALAGALSSQPSFTFPGLVMQRLSVPTTGRHRSTVNRMRAFTRMTLFGRARPAQSHQQNHKRAILCARRTAGKARPAARDHKSRRFEGRHSFTVSSSISQDVRNVGATIRP